MRIEALVLAGGLLAFAAMQGFAQRPTASASLVDAPEPQSAIDSSPTQSPPGPQQTPSSQSSPPPSTSDKTDREKAAEQIKEQERQRVLGVIPMFNTSYRGNAVSLTSKEKMSLAFRSAVDPVTFATAFAVAGLH